AVGFGGESGLRKFGLCGTHPLTQRYVLGDKIESSIYAGIERILSQVHCYW
ncbi:TPA: DUF3265 domain-containing protein, partial [Vibrio vulnificus]|nr:DUF3265 domain-containing protein [Vibrio vulnificus]